MGSPEVNQVLPELPSLGDLIKNLYDCHYDKFFVALGMPPNLIYLQIHFHPVSIATLEQTHLLPSRILSPHARYYVREMRILAYGQLLESYRSLTLESLSGAFGVSVGFVDRCVSSSPHTTITFPYQILCLSLVLMMAPQRIVPFHSKRSPPLLH
jgi:26S proteasome regulatory subunit N7